MNNVNLSYIKSLGITDKPEQFYSDVVATKATGRDEITGYAALWGDPAKVDLERDYFTPTTDFWDEALGGLARILPLTWNHNADKSQVQDAVIGSIVEMQDNKIGRFYRAILKRSHEYRALVDKMIAQGLLGTSSEALPAYVAREKTYSGKSFITTWPLVAASLTDTPAEPRMIGTLDRKTAALFADVIDPQPVLTDLEKQRRAALRYFEFMRSNLRY